MASPTRSRKRALAAAPPAIHPADRLSRLPEELLAQILSLLPAQEAVRTCVLARAWRDVWRSTRRLLITGATVQEVREFVGGLLRRRFDARELASLDECEIRFRMYNDCDSLGTVDCWIRAALLCQVRALRVLNEGHEQHKVYFMMSDKPLVSLHLTRLELSGMGLRADLDLDGCPALEQLEIRSCFFLGLTKIVSPSLRRLVVTGCNSIVGTQGFRISAPCLVSLWLEATASRAPLLESMPELVEAYVRIESIDSFLLNNCYCDDPMRCHHLSDSNVDSDNEEYTEDYPGQNTEGCVLLEGLAQAKDLVLLAYHSMDVFRRDLRLCPTFSNLKALVLNGYWFEPADCHALACILEHAPVLEKLTILFSKKVELKYDIVLEGCPDAAAKSTMTTQCLKAVKIKCHTVHGRVHNVLKFLSTLNICFKVTEGST